AGRPAKLVGWLRSWASVGDVAATQNVVLLATKHLGGPVNLTPRERDKLMIAMAALVARGRRARGLKLNYPESIALISDFVLEGAREGKSVAELMSQGSRILTRAEVMEGVG